MPLAMASDEERLAAQELRRARAARARAALPADVAPAARHAGAAHPPPREGAPRPAHRHAAHAARAACARAATRSASPAGAGASSARRLVMLCDISGSMEPYARAYLQFLTCAAGSGPNAEAFAFATRLTRLTRALASRHPERAIQRAAAAAPDWSSGTRIGDALKAFNDRHGRRGMARGAVVVILSDGWERGDPALVGREMERLARLAHRIVWVNPRVGASAFSVRAGRHGRRAAALRRARERPQLRGPRRGGRRDRGALGGARRRPAPPRRRPRPPTSRRPGPAPPRSPAARWPCPAGTARAGATPRPGWVTRCRRRPDLHLPGMRAARGARRTRRAGRGPPSATWSEHNALTAHQERQRLARAANRDHEEDQ